MKILKMTATFGKLNHQTMELSEGLNLIPLPNESGKSTWVAFLTAMFYGIPTSERASKNSLPAKSRYQPWSGSPMEGQIEIEWQGRPMTISRASGPQGPMAEFEAYWSDTGMPVSGMNGSNCGKMLLGVNRAVFERSALIRSNAMSVSQSPELEACLSAAISSDPSGSSYSRILRTLKDWQNARQYNKSGLLPDAIAHRDTLKAQLDELNASSVSSSASESELEALLAERHELDKQLRRLGGAVEIERSVSAAQAEAERLERYADSLKDEALPPLSELEELMHQLDGIEKDAKTLTARTTTDGATSGAKLAVFDGLTREQVLQKAEDDTAKYKRLHRKGIREKLTPLVALVALVLAAVSFFVMPTLFGYIVCGLLVLTGVLFLGLSYATLRRGAGAQADALLAAYGVNDAEGILDAAQAYLERQNAHRQPDNVYRTQKAELSRRVTALRERVTPIGRSDSIRGCRETLKEARARRIKLDEACEEARQARAVYDRLVSSVGTTEDNTNTTAEELSAQIDALDNRITALRNELSMERGRLSAIGSAPLLTPQLEAAELEVTRLRRELDALALAQTAITTAGESIHNRVFPQLTATANRYITDLTDGRYTNIVMDSDLNISARADDDLIDRRIITLSDGTADQLYLALRLSICDAALPADAPILLDDALITFDDARLDRALTLLETLSAERQILLFSCTNREAVWNNQRDAHV